MRITRIDLEGRTGRYATITRKRGSNQIEVTILTPQTPQGRVHQVNASDEDDLFSMAQCLQNQLDQCQGTSSMVHEYFRALQRFQD